MNKIRRRLPYYRQIEAEYEKRLNIVSMLRSSVKTMCNGNDVELKLTNSIGAYMTTKIPSHLWEKISQIIIDNVEEGNEDIDKYLDEILEGKQDDMLNIPKM